MDSSAGPVAEHSRQQCHQHQQDFAGVASHTQVQQQRLQLDRAAAAAALPNAVRAQDAALVQQLLEAGADPNSKLASGRSVLMLAAAVGNACIVLQLLEAGADPLAHSPHGCSVLMQAAQSNKLQAVELLLAAGVPVNQANSKGHTALFAAADAGCDQVVKLLLSKGAAWQVRPKHTYPRFRAVYRDHGAVVDTLLACSRHSGSLEDDLYEVVSAAVLTLELWPDRVTMAGRLLKHVVQQGARGRAALLSQPDECRPVLRLGMLQAWAAHTATQDAQHAALATVEECACQSLAGARQLALQLLAAERTED